VRFIGEQSCLAVGAHHLRFAQNRALGRAKSTMNSPYITGGSHREIHRSGEGHLVGEEWDWPDGKQSNN